MCVNRRCRLYPIVIFYLLLQMRTTSNHLGGQCCESNILYFALDLGKNGLRDFDKYGLTDFVKNGLIGFDKNGLIDLVKSGLIEFVKNDLI